MNIRVQCPRTVCVQQGGLLAALSPRQGQRALLGARPGGLPARKPLEGRGDQARLTKATNLVIWTTKGEAGSLSLAEGVGCGSQAAAYRPLAGPRKGPGRRRRTPGGWAGAARGRWSNDLWLATLGCRQLPRLELRRRRRRAVGVGWPDRPLASTLTSSRPARLLQSKAY